VFDSFTTTQITNAINNLGTIGTVTQVSAVSSLAALSNIVTNTTTTPTITLGIVGSPTNSEFLRGDGTWAVPSSTGVASITTTSPITDTGTASIPNIGITEATTSTDGYLSSTYWNIFNNKMPTFTITNNGTTGAAAFNSAGTELNIPVYTGGGGSGGVSSVGLTMPSAFTVSTPNPIISAGTFVVAGSGTTDQFIDGTGALQATSSIAGTYSWLIDGDSGAATTVASGDTIEFAGGTSIETDWDSGLKRLTIDYTGASGITSIIATSSNTASLGPSPALTANGTLTIPWNGTSNDVVLGNGSLQTLSTIPGTYTFSLQGDSGGPTAISSGGTIGIEGGTNITTTLTGNTLTIDGPSSLGTVTSVGSSDSNFISGGVTGGAGADPILTTGNLEYSLRAIGTPDATKFLRGDGNGVWSALVAGPGVASIVNDTSSPYNTTIGLDYTTTDNFIKKATNSSVIDAQDTIVINDATDDNVKEVSVGNLLKGVSGLSAPIYFSIEGTTLSNIQIINNGNISSTLADCPQGFGPITVTAGGGNISNGIKVQFANRTDTSTDYMVTATCEAIQGTVDIKVCAVTSKAAKEFTVVYNKSASGLPGFGAPVLTNIIIYK
jgi:hypothetical protein